MYLYAWASACGPINVESVAMVGQAELHKPHLMQPANWMYFSTSSGDCKNSFVAEVISESSRIMYGLIRL